MLKFSKVLKIILVIFMINQISSTCSTTGYKVDFNTGNCVDCNTFFYGDVCYSKCPAEMPYFDSGGSGSKLCKASCDNLKDIDQGCLSFSSSCPSNKVRVGDDCEEYCGGSSPYKPKSESDQNTCLNSCGSDYHYRYQCYNTDQTNFHDSAEEKKCLKCNPASSTPYYDETDDQCKINCPSERPYYDDYNECHAECSGVAKYHDLGDFKCKTQCTGDGVITFNYICYPSTASCPSGTKKTDNGCECLDKFVLESVGGGKTIINCLSPGTPCPIEKKYINADKQCVSQTTCTTFRKTTTSPFNYECVNDCNSDELFYTSEGDVLKFCVTECPYSKPYIDQSTKKCLDDCLSNTHLDESTKTCVSTCPGTGLFIYDQSIQTTSKFKCYSGTECPSTFPYFYRTKNVCMNSCQNLKVYYGDFGLPNSVRYYYDEVSKECFTTKCEGNVRKNAVCKESASGVLTDGCKCVQSCNEEGGELIYTYDGYCYGDTCDSITGHILGNSVSLTGTKPFATLYGTNECIKKEDFNDYFKIVTDPEAEITILYKDGCPAMDSTNSLPLFQDSNTKNCYTNRDGCLKKINLDTKKCIDECLSPSKAGLENEGYYLNDGTDKVCYKKCPGGSDYYIGNKCYTYDQISRLKTTDTDNKYLIIDGTYEYCINNCPDGYFKFNDVCYYGSCPLNTKLSNGNCECVDKYYYPPSSSEKKCLGLNEACPSGYKFLVNNGKECTQTLTSTNCDSSSNRLNQISSDPELYECVASTSCGSSYFIYTSGGYTYCVYQCPNPVPFHEENSQTCIQSCVSSTHFTDEVNHICYTNCPGSGLSLLNSNGNAANKGNCISDYSCPQTEPYLYKEKKVCVSSCSLTASHQFINEPTHLDSSNNECVKTCPNKYYDSYNNICVDQCSTDQFIDSTDSSKCIPSCGINKPYVYETRKCISGSSCGTDYFTEAGYNYICYEKCPTNYYIEIEKNDLGTIVSKNCYRSGCGNSGDNIYLLEGTKTCSKCEEGEGFQVTGDYTCYKKCPSSCPYYEVESNLCKDSCNNGGNKNIRQLQEDGTYKCIEKSSCTSDYIFNKECYSSLPPNTEKGSATTPDTCICVDKYYEDSNGKKVCLNAGDPCPSTKKYFGQDKKCTSDVCRGDTANQKQVTIKGVVNIECKNSCDSEFTYPIGNTDSPVYCYDKCPEDKPYHNYGEKKCLEKCDSTTHFTDSTNFICYKICPNLATVDELNLNENGKIAKKGKCISDVQCPTNYPYLYEAQKICVSDCSKTNVFIFDNNNFPSTETKLDASKKQCVSACGTGRFIENVSGQCLDRCKEGQFVYVNKCYEKCSDVTNARIKYGTNECTLCQSNDSEGYKNLLDNGNKDNYCYKECPEGSHISLDESGNQIGCVSQCSNFLIEKTNTCKSECAVADGFYDPNIITNKVCYEKCPEGTPYYAEGSNKCYVIGCPVPDNNNKFLQEGSHLCSNSCNTYSFNNVCYTNSCPDLTEKSTSTDHTCQCIYKYYEKTAGGEKVCLGAGEPCPSGKQYIVDGKCTNTCTGFLRQISSSPVNYQCVVKCDKEEFIYKETQADNTIIKYCVSKCPEKKSYYNFELDYDNTGPRVCQEGCEASTHYTDNINHICYKDCPNLNTIDETDSSNKLGICIHDTKCPTYKPYMFKNKYCLSSCTLTFDRFSGITTYLDKTTNQCIISTTTPCSKFIDVADGNGNDCVEKCASNQFVYYSTTEGEASKCYNKCPTQSTPGTVDGPNFKVEELMQCVKSCSSIGYYSNGYINTDLKCYKTCPTNYYAAPDFKCYYQTCPDSAKFLKISLNKCVLDCTLPTNLNNIGEKEGFTTKPKDDSGYIICYDKCPNPHKYREYGKNLCLETTAGKYLIDGTNELISPTDDGKCPITLPGSVTNNYKYLLNNVCYQICPENTEKDDTTQNCECSFKSYIESGIKVCLGPNVPCPEGKIYFDKDNICSSTSCNNLFKKIETIPVNYQCYDDNILTCPYNDYQYGSECFTKCPENTYHLFGQYTCYNSCVINGKNYFVDKKNFICYEDCPGLSAIDENNNYECIEGPTCAVGKYYYENGKKYCLSSCNLTNSKSLGGKTVADNENFFCTSTCGNKFKDNINDKCVDVCPDGSFLNGINGKECYDTLENLKNAVKDTSLTKYLVKNKLNYVIANRDLGNYYQASSGDVIYEVCPDTLYQDDLDKKCHTENECTGENKYIKKSTYKCVECKFPDDINSVKSEEGFIKNSGSKECIETCNTPLNSPYLYYKTGSKTCEESGDDTYKYLIEGTNEYTKACPNNYYLFNRLCYKYKCPENTEYNATDKKCQCSYKFTRALYSGSSTEYEYTCYAKDKSCDTEKFFDQEKGCVNSCTTDRPYIKEISSGTAVNQECVKECALGEFKYLKEADSKKYCVDKCPMLKKYHNFGDVECIEKCDGKYTDNRDFTCRTKCDGLALLDETNNNKGECISGTTCPERKKLYAPLNLCISDCSKTSSTQLASIFGRTIKTYLFESNECVEHCTNTLSKKYISSDSEECIDSCNNGEFYNTNGQDKKCTSASCDNYYIFETKECVASCAGYYVIDEPTDADEGKICYQTCPERNKNNEKLYTKQSNSDEKKCVKCDKISDGYFFDDSKGICYIKCPNEARNHEDGKNKCINGCTKDYQYEDLVTTSNDMYTCYASQCNNGGKSVNYQCYSRCTDVAGFKEDSNGKCVCETDSGQKFYKDKNVLGDEILKCLSANAQCPGTKPYLLDGKECVEKCDEGYYTDEKDKKCYSSETKIPKEKYYKESTKIVFSKCQIPLTDTLGTYEGYYIEPSDTNQIAVECFDTCPTGNEYHNIGTNKCIDSCTGDTINIIENTKICTKDCPTGYYLFNTICYKDKCPDNSQYDSVSKKCLCKYKYKEDGSVITCLGENESCDKFFLGNKKCVDDCSEYIKRIKDTDNDHQCVALSACPYFYTQAGVNYCLKKCESDMYYTDGSYECKKITSPIPCNFYDEVNKICYQNSCPKLQKLADENSPTQNKFICLDTDECPSTSSNIYYEYKKTCFTSCDVATSFNSGTPTTYTTIEKDPNDLSKSLYRCVEDCSTNPTQKFTDKNSFKCLEECDNISGIYFFDNKCYSSCTNLKDSSGNSVTAEYHLDDTKECVNGCPDGYYKDESNKICYKKCPNYTKISAKTCVSCSNPSTLPSIEEDEGYIVLNDNEKICYSSCPMNAPYHNNGDNKCFSGPCNSSTNYENTFIFTKYGAADFTCYSSCSGIGTEKIVTVVNHCVEGSECPELYPYSYTENDKTTCYKDSCPNEGMKTTENKIMDNNIFKYTVHICIPLCVVSNSDTDLIYQQGDLCVTGQCDQSLGYDYFVKAEQKISVGLCYKTKDECIKYGYKYITQSNECKATCAGTDEKKIENDAISSKGSCVTSCPQDYPYYYNNVCYQKGCPANTYIKDPSATTTQIDCVAECGSDKIEFNGKCSVTGNCLNQVYKFLNEEYTNNKHCVAECPGGKPFYFLSDGKCLEKCIDLSDQYTFYNPITKECIPSTSSCISTNTHLFHKGTYGSLSEPTACLEKCEENEFYYEADKKCLSSCDNYYSSSNPKVCVNDCGINEKIIWPTKQCTQSCSKYYPYQVTYNDKKYCVESCDGNDVDVNTRSWINYLESNKECVEKCQGIEIFLYNKVCKSICPGNQPNYYEKDTGIYTCISSSCTEITGFNYHNDGDKQCIAKCTGNTYKYTIYNGKTCYDSCPSNYYQYEPVDGIINCKMECTSSDGFINGKYCKNACDSDTPYILESGNQKTCYAQCPKDYYISNSNCVKCNRANDFIVNDKCLSKCPKDLNYIGKNNVCKSRCEDEDGTFYYLYDTVYLGSSTTDVDYKIYHCLSQCSENTQYGYHIINQKECLGQCDSNYPYSNPTKICYSLCKLDPDYKYSLYDSAATPQNKCVNKCPLYHDEDFKCTSTCESNTPAIDENGKCVAKCDLTSNYKYQITDIGTNDKCYTSCSETTAKNFRKSDYICISGCDANEYIRNTGECATSCDQNSDYKFAKLSGDIYTCVENCDSSYYYDNKKICLDNCDNGYVIDGTNQCSLTCPPTGDYKDYIYFYTPSSGSPKTCVKSCPLTDKKFKWPDNTCVSGCGLNTDYPYYVKDENTCLDKCPENYVATKKTDGYECSPNCIEGEYISNGQCVTDCSILNDDYKYHIEDTFTCIKRCTTEYFIKDTTCVKICSTLSEVLYAENYKCVENCSDERKFFVKDTSEKICLIDCPVDHPYYVEENGKNACYDNCPNSEQHYTREVGKVAKKCIASCNDETTTGIFLDSDQKQCFKKCPSNLPYYEKYSTAENVQCLEKCPKDTYHEVGGFECKQYTECSPGTHIDYDTQTCLEANEKCKSTQYEYSTDQNGKFLCLNSCELPDSKLFITPDNKCVKECSESDNLQVENDTSNKCVCKKLFYFEPSTGLKKCLSKDLNTCKKNTAAEGQDGYGYTIPVYDSLECVNVCRTMLSEKGECLPDFTCPNSNTEESINEEGVRYCKCKYKWEVVSDLEVNCLGENEGCPALKDYVVYGTNECVETCPSGTYILIDICVKECPENSDLVDNKCGCVNNWITNEKGGRECLPQEANCPENKPYLVAATKECVNKCPDSYRLLYKDECRGAGLGLCESFNYKEIAVNDESPIKDIADFTCGCDENEKWYNDISGNVVCKGDISDCSEITENTFDYEVYKTKQCVISCPKTYPYKYDYHCYDECPQGTILNEINNECTCPDYYVKKTDDFNKVRITCIFDNYECDYSKQLCIVSKKECIEFADGETKKCPLDYPYQVNGNCYEKCPEGFHYDAKNVDSCSCDNLTYKKTDDSGIEKTYCVDKCPSDKKYVNDETKECESDPTIFSFIFNNVGYKNHCPEDTKLKSGNICVCNDLYGFWYKEDTQDDSGYVCSLTSCPINGIYKYNLDGTKQCVSQGQCATLNQFTYRSTCYANCPDNREEDTVNYKCKSDVTEATSVDDLNSILKNEIFRYYEENPNGFEYSNFGVSSQIIGINQTVDEYKEFLIKSNLTYIDLTKCMDKIYKANSLSSDDKLILLKIDITNAVEDYLINPVEYEIYSAKTEKKIDISVCENKEIIVSYPIIEKLNTFNRLRNLEINKTILTPKQQYSIAKKLHDEDNSIDAFNINSTLYSKFCSECVINGKDLILRDRLPYIYPLKYSLCENNCTFAYTDYEKDRVNCYCHYKTIINIKKKYYSNLVEVNNDEIDDKQQGPTNFPVLQCMDEYKVKNNGSFVFTLIILIIELILFIVTITIGIKALFKKIKTSTFGENEENEQKDDIKENSNSINNNIAVYTEHRKLNIASSDRNVLESKSNPPPKNNSGKENEESDMENAEYIPEAYIHLFFSVKDNGVTKEVKRSKLPFKVAKTTKFLYEKNDSSKSGGTLKRNTLKIIDDIDEDESEIEIYSNAKTANNAKMKNGLKQNINNQNNNNYVEGDNNLNDYANKHKRSISNSVKQKNKPALEDISEKEEDAIDVVDKNVYDDEDLLTILRNEKKNIDNSYEYAIKKDRASVWIMIFTFILDKVYITKLFLFKRKYDILSVLGSIYLLYHILILSLVTMFFNLSTLSKIFFEDYPTVGFYILYGLFSNLIAWFIYRLLYCLVKNNTTIVHFVNKNKILPNLPQTTKINKNLSEKRMNKLKGKIKFKLVVYFIVQWAMLLFCFFYLCLFSSIYRGAKKEIFKTYGIALLEIFIIRIVYGILLGCLRYASINSEIECLYKVVKFFDVYLS